MCNPKPSLNQKVIDMYDAGYCVHKISKHLGIHLGRVKGVITHLLAERDLAKKQYVVPGSLDDIEKRIWASLLNDDPSVRALVLGSPTGRITRPEPELQSIKPSNAHKPRMSPTDYLEIARAMANERIAEKQRADEETQSLRDINPHKLVAAMAEYEDLAQLATLALNEISRRYGKNSPTN